MQETTDTTGTRGLMKVQDNTDGDDKTVDLYIASSLAIHVASLPWSYSIDGVNSGTNSFEVVSTTAWQHIKKVFVGYASQFVFHIGDSGTVELGGPTDLAVDLANSTKLIDIKVGDVWVKALPYVNVGGVDGVGGVWQPAVPMIQVNSVWTEVV